MHKIAPKTQALKENGIWLIRLGFLGAAWIPKYLLKKTYGKDWNKFKKEHLLGYQKSLGLFVSKTRNMNPENDGKDKPIREVKQLEKAPKGEYQLLDFPIVSSKYNGKKRFHRILEGNHFGYLLSQIYNRAPIEEIKQDFNFSYKNNSWAEIVMKGKQINK